MDINTKQKKFVTTAINYTNGEPHFGHAYEIIVADVLARYYRINGKDVYFMTGTDEHGQKVAEAAEAQGLKPIELCNKYVVKFQNLNDKLSISNDFYIRTTNKRHYEICQWLWNECKANGDIYLGEYSGWYSVREERFFTEMEAKSSDYKDPGSGKPLLKRSEPSYFFKMSKYYDQLVAHIKSHENFVVPEERKNEVLTRLTNEPLHDLSISRATFEWGIPVPEDSSAGKHVMYVWFDALANYLTGVDYPSNGPLRKYWSADVHVIGKDIVWFHAVIWPCMLMSAKIPLPATILCHGFVNGSDGRKMSKSYGNVVDPALLLETIAADAIRYFVMREGVFGGDFNFSQEHLAQTHDFELAAAFGNLAQRGFSLSEKYCASKVPTIDSEEIFSVSELYSQYEMYMSKFQIHAAIDTVVQVLKKSNKYLTDKAPWHIKDEDEKSVNTKHRIIRTVLEAVYICSHFLQPLIPTAVSKLVKTFNTNLVNLNQLGWGCLKPNTVLGKGEILFKRLQLSRFEASEQEAAVEDKPQDQSVSRANDISMWKLVVGKVMSCVAHTSASHLFIEQINIGTQTIQVVSALAGHITLEALSGKMIVVLVNMKAKKFRGETSLGMVIAAKKDTAVELVEAPAGAVPGEVISFAGYQHLPLDVLTENNINKVKADLNSSENCIATYKGVPFMTSAGPCKVKSLTNSPLC